MKFPIMSFSAYYLFFFLMKLKLGMLQNHG